MTRAAFENAMVVVMALGGSTNAVLHLIAMARAVGRAADDRRLPDGQRPRAVPGRSEAERQVRAGRPARRRRHAGRDEVPAREGPARRRLPDRHRQDARREPRRPAGPRSRARTSSARSTTRSRRPATSRSCAATSRPTAPWPRSPARKACASPARPRSSTREEDMLAALERKRDRQGRRGHHPLRRPQGRPGHARDAHADLGASWAPASARTWP